MPQLMLQIDDFNEHLAIEALMSINDNKKPIMYWDVERSCLRELKVVQAKLIDKRPTPPPLVLNAGDDDYPLEPTHDMTTCADHNTCEAHGWD